MALAHDRLLDHHIEEIPGTFKDAAAPASEQRRD